MNIIGGGFSGTISYNNVTKSVKKFFDNKINFFKELYFLRLMRTSIDISKVLSINKSDISIEYPYYNKKKAGVFGLNVNSQNRIKMCNIVLSLYDKGIIHHDIISENVMYDQFGNCILIDFAECKLMNILNTIDLKCDSFSLCRLLSISIKHVTQINYDSLLTSERTIGISKNHIDPLRYPIFTLSLNKLLNNTIIYFSDKDIELLVKHKPLIVINCLYKLDNITLEEQLLLMQFLLELSEDINNYDNKILSSLIDKIEIINIDASKLFSNILAIKYPNLINNYEEKFEILKERIIKEKQYNPEWNDLIFLA